MKTGYYWVKFPSDPFACIGWYDAEAPHGLWAWEFVGSDEPTDIGPNVEVIGPVQPPPGVAVGR